MGLDPGERISFRRHVVEQVEDSTSSQCDGTVEILDDALVSVMDGQPLAPDSLRSMVAQVRACP